MEGGVEADLATLASLVAARRTLEEAERELRIRLRWQGVSFARIGRVYGISRQAARIRFERDRHEDMANHGAQPLS